VNYLVLGSWIRRYGFTVPTRQSDRVGVFKQIVDRVGEPLLYLEFGVYRGASLRIWSDLLKADESRLIGFDSFEGLPETFSERSATNAGAFDTQGEPPAIDDARVSLQVGRFEDTLADFQMPQHRGLVINIDADLYSSTRTVLDALRDQIAPGTVIYFDDFSQVHHEPRAFGDFLRASGLRFTLISAELTLTHLAFIRV
jgi:hypothetical protein